MAAKINSKRRNKIKLKIAKRDKWICWLCGEPVREEIVWRNKNDSPSLDHVIAQCDGGSNAQSNLKLAHRKCNNERNHSKLL